MSDPPWNPDNLPRNLLDRDRFVQFARDQIGDPYRFGAEARFGELDPTAFDSSELVEWAAHRVGLTDMPDGSWHQYRWLHERGAAVSVEEALQTKGALVFGFSSDPLASPDRPARAYVGISLGDGRVLDVSERAGEVREMDPGGFYNYGAVIPELHGIDDGSPLDDPLGLPGGVGFMPAPDDPVTPVGPVIPAGPVDAVTGADPLQPVDPVHPADPGDPLDPDPGTVSTSPDGRILHEQLPEPDDERVRGLAPNADSGPGDGGFAGLDAGWEPGRLFDLAAPLTEGLTPLLGVDPALARLAAAAGVPGLAGHDELPGHDDLPGLAGLAGLDDRDGDPLGTHHLRDLHGYGGDHVGHLHDGHLHDGPDAAVDYDELVTSGVHGTGYELPEPDPTPHDPTFPDDDPAPASDVHQAFDEADQVEADMDDVFEGP